MSMPAETPAEVTAIGEVATQEATQAEAEETGVEETGVEETGEVAMPVAAIWAEVGEISDRRSWLVQRGTVRLALLGW